MPFTQLRLTFLYTTLALCTWCNLATETLNLFHFITIKGILLAWLLPLIIICLKPNLLLTFIHNSMAVIRHLITTSWMFNTILLLTTISLFLAIAYPPNNYDSMTYHMARVAHWIQNRSISFYPTHVGRQLIFQPFAEWIILHIQLLTGGDRFANTIQLFFFIGCISNITLITKDLSGSPHQQMLSGLLACLIPMALLQSNTTQNDVVAAFFVTSFAYLTISLQKRTTPFLLIMAGLSLGLAWLTKGTAYIFTASFLAWYLIPVIRRPDKVLTILRFAFIPLIAILINAGFFYRNLNATGSMLGTANNDIATQGKAFKPLIIVGAKDLLNHFPVNARIKQMVISGAGKLGVDANDPKYSYTPTSRMPEGFYFDEDNVQNFPHTLLIIPATLYFLSRKSLYTSRLNYYKLFVLTLLAGSVLFCVILKWQPWANRLETSLFMLFCVFLAKEITTRWIQYTILILTIAFSTTALLLSTRHPLLPLKKSIFQRPYDSFIYSKAILQCQSILDQKPYSKIGIIIGGDSRDYPYYKLLSRWKGGTRTLEHVMVSNISSKYDKGFIPDAIISIDSTKTQYIIKGHIYARTMVFSDGSALFE